MADAAARAQRGLPLRECCRLYLIGMFCNLWMPTNIGGDAVRAYLAAPAAGKPSRRPRFLVND